MLGIIRKYISEVITEFRKIIFPSKNDVYLTSIYVVMIVVFVVLSIIFVDFLIDFFMKLVIFGLEK